MKSRKIFLSIFTICLLIFLFGGCSDDGQDKGYAITDLYQVTKNSDGTYSCYFTDRNGKVLFEKQDAAREPRVTRITPTLYEICTQTGTGLSTNWAVFCDAEKSLLSEPFYYVLTAKAQYVVTGDYADGDHYIVVQDIFDKEQYYKEYKLENVSPVAADYVVDCKIEKNECIVTYLAGEDYTETEFVIPFP